MKDEQHQFLTLLGQLPARLTAEQTAWVLNCQTHDVAALVATRLLKPLGNPAANAVKFFATADVVQSSQDHAWLIKMTNAVNRHWQKKNAAKTKVYDTLPPVASHQSGLDKGALVAA